MVEARRPYARALPSYQLPLPLEPSAPGAALTRWPPPTARPHQVWGSLPPTERLRAQRVFVQILQEVVRNGANA